MVPLLIRLMERLIDLLVGYIIQQLFALMRRSETYHKEDANFDFIKSKKGLLSVSRGNHIKPMSEATLLLCNDTSVLEHVWLMTTFSPVLVVMDFDAEGKAGLRCIGALERVTRACGISFPVK